MSLSANELTYEFHPELNPAVWTEKELDLVVRDKLLQIAEAFIDYLDVDIDIEDITLTGSLANYNYTKYSDFDLHIITDFGAYGQDKELIKDYFSAKKTIWNTVRHITVKGYNVELYVQDIAQEHYSTGVYSLKDDAWLIEPKPTRDKADIDKEQVLKKKQAMLDIIDFALSSDCPVEDAESAKEKFMNLRKAGFETGGELSPENLAFKELRRSGDIERFFKGIISKKDRMLSLDSVQKETANYNFKNFLKVSTKRGPHHLKPMAGVARLTNPEAKSLGVVAQMHKIGNDIKPVHKLKKQFGGYTPIPHGRAQEIIARYGLDIHKLQSGVPRQLSTSGISLGFNPQSNTFYLSK